MSRMTKTMRLVVLCALIIAVPSVWANWARDGGALCTAKGNHRLPMVTSDDFGGAFVTSYDGRSGSYNIYAQRINASGVVQWTANGVALCTAPEDQLTPTIASDGAGGALVTWEDYRVGNWDIFAQRVNASGAIRWTTDGVVLCTSKGDQSYPTITSDGAGGAIVTWQENRSGSLWDIRAQRVSASGAVQWTANGVALCAATGTQMQPQVTSDGAGGAIVTWYDYRSGHR